LYFYHPKASHACKTNVTFMIRSGVVLRDVIVTRGGGWVDFCWLGGMGRWRRVGVGASRPDWRSRLLGRGWRDVVSSGGWRGWRGRCGWRGWRGPWGKRAADGADGRASLWDESTGIGGCLAEQLAFHWPVEVKPPDGGMLPSVSSDHPQAPSPSDVKSMMLK
jgi:hypothetical protein